MSDRYLEITYRRGRILAAYLYLSREEGDVVDRSEELAPGLMVDRSSDGRILGFEIFSSRHLSGALIDRVLADASLPLLGEGELGPLQQAA